MKDIQKEGGQSSADRVKFEQAVVETRYTGQGEPYYIIKDGLELETYAALAKAVLESEKDIAHDFQGKVISESGDREAVFEYKSGWFLDGLANGEIE